MLHKLHTEREHVVSQEQLLEARDELDWSAKNPTRIVFVCV
jgi:hypothetical protein